MAIQYVINGDQFVIATTPGVITNAKKNIGNAENNQIIIIFFRPYWLFSCLKSCDVTVVLDWSVLLLMPLQPSLQRPVLSTGADLEASSFPGLPKRQ